jgi:hypothetical protein
MGLGQQAPLTPEYQAIFDASLRDQAKGGQGNNYQAACVLSGMPRIMSLAGPMEMLVQQIHTLMIFQNALPRRIYTDGRDWPKSGEPSFQGYSIGKWIDEDGDGQYDVLEVETRNLREPRAYDVTGLPFAGDGKTVIKERVYLEKGDPNVLWDDITVVDSSLTRPYFKHQKTIRTNQAWTSETCAADNNWVKIGDENYFVNTADGRLMPSKKGQRPPDLFYFNLPQK